MTNLPPISPPKLSFKHRDDCPVSMLHLETFGDAAQRKKKIWDLKLRFRGYDPEVHLDPDDIEYLREAIGYDGA